MKKYINSNIIDNEFSKIIVKAQNYRIKSDYLDFFVVSKSEAVEQYENAKRFIEKLSELIEQKYKS